MKKLLLIALAIVGCQNSTEYENNFPTECMIILEMETCIALEELGNHLEESFNNANITYESWNTESKISFSQAQQAYNNSFDAFSQIQSCWEESCE